MTYGESVNAISVRVKENSYTIRLLPCSSWTVWGDDPDPMEWLYEVQIQPPTPSPVISTFPPQASVIFVQQRAISNRGKDVHRLVEPA